MHFGTAGVLMVIFIYSLNRLELKIHLLLPLWTQLRRICVSILASSTTSDPTKSSSSNESSNEVLYGRAGMLLGLHWFSIEFESSSSSLEEDGQDRVQELEEIKYQLSGYILEIKVIEQEFVPT